MLAFLLLHVLPLNAQACTCSGYLLDLPIKEMGWTQSESEGISSFNDLIFRGTLIETIIVTEEQLYSGQEKRAEEKTELLFVISKVYKGKATDTVRIRTSLNSDVCGFYARPDTECLIFANQGSNGFFYTYRSDCCKSISREREEKRYNKYINFLETMLQKIDGEYTFKQSPNYWGGGYPDTTESIDLITYTIRNGHLEGTWKITDRRGRVLEEGAFKNGEKVGTWVVISYASDPYISETITTEQIAYDAGRPKKSTTIVKTKTYNNQSGTYELSTTQSTSTTFTYH